MVIWKHQVTLQDSYYGLAKWLCNAPYGNSIVCIGPPTLASASLFKYGAAWWGVSGAGATTIISWLSWWVHLDVGQYMLYPCEMFGSTGKNQPMNPAWTLWHPCLVFSLGSLVYIVGTWWCRLVWRKCHGGCVAFHDAILLDADGWLRLAFVQASCDICKFCRPISYWKKLAKISPQSCWTQKLATSGTS